MTQMLPPLEAIVMGGSSGAIDALDAILSVLPRTLGLPVALALHILPGKPSGLAGLFGGRCALPVKEAEDKEPLVSGTVYLASPNYHLLIERQHHFSLSVDDPVHFSRPSIDVLFESAADAYGPGLTGVLLSGANEDGARGLERIHAAGGVTVVQAPDTASAPQMPDAALRLFRADHVLPPGKIGLLLARLALERAGSPTPSQKDRG